MDWKNAGKPECGALYEKKNSDKKDVGSRINAVKERLQAEYHDKKFKVKANNRFHTLSQGTDGCSRLLIDITNKLEVFAAWVSHFEQLGSSKVSESITIQAKISSYKSSLLLNEDYVLDTEMNIEEIEAAIAKMKCCGPDGILPEYLIYSDPTFRMRLKIIF